MATEPIDAAEAAQIIEASRQRRGRAAAEAIQAVLTEYNCQLAAVPQLTPDGRIVALVQIVAR